MIIEEYKKARKLAQKQYRKAMMQGESPYPLVLDQILAKETTAGEKQLGLMEIPVSLIKGTKTEGRRNSFSNEFLPLLEEETEFANKWMRLFDSQMEEGIREAIKVYEYKGYFYVQEGNKRVSIMKYLKMSTMYADVTRILPERSDENKKYYEYVRFFEKTKINTILFSKLGSYGKLLDALGKTWEDSWTEEEVRGLKSIYYHFTVMYQNMNGKQDPVMLGDAFLRCLDVFTYEELREKSSVSIQKAIKNMKKELTPDAVSADVEYVMDPLQSKAQPKISRLLPLPEKQIKAAFLYDRNKEESEWVYGHELGRTYVNRLFKERLYTKAVENISAGEDAEAQMEQMIKEGYTVFFLATPIHIKTAMKMALKYPDIFFFNCSLSFPYKSVRIYHVRMYEVKFLTGLIAGSMLKGDTILYEADYPIYGSVANINAFALGVQMVRPDAKVKLRWTCLKDENPEEKDEAYPMVSARDMLKPKDEQKKFGLYCKKDGEITTLATCFVDWGRFYERMLDLIFDGTWKKIPPRNAKSFNYWWGFSADVIELVHSHSLPYGTKRLVESYKKYITWGTFHPFEGILYDQQGRAHGQEHGPWPAEKIVRMDWLCSNVEGCIPEIHELNEKARKLVKLQGVQEER